MRHVEQAHGVFGVQVVGVLRLGGRGREEVRLGELVVFETAPGVVDATAPAVGDALLELENRGVVLVAPLGVLTHEDVAELRERAEQLTALHRGAIGREARTRAEERVGHLLEQRGAERHVAGIELVDVQNAVVRAAEAEVAARGAGVFEANRHAARQFAVDVDRVLLHVGGLLVLIDELDLAAHTGERAARVAHRLKGAALERVRQRDGGLELPLLKERVLAVADLAVVGRAHALVVPGRPVDAVAGTHDRLRVERVDEADTGRELQRGLVALFGGRAVLAGVDETAAHGAAVHDDVAEGATGVERAVEGHREAVFLLTQTGLRFHAHTHVQGELRVDAEVVLQVATVVVHVGVQGFRHAHAAQVARVARGQAEQEARERVAALQCGRAARRPQTVEVEEARAGRVGLRVGADAAEVEAGLDGLAAEELRRGGVGAPRVPHAVGGVDGTEGRAAITVFRHVAAGELLLLDGAREARVEAQGGRVEFLGEEVGVIEAREAVAERQHGVVAGQPRVVHGEQVHAAGEQVLVRIREVVLAPEAGAGFVGLVVEVEARERHLVVEAVVALHAVELRAVFDLRDADEVGGAVADVAVGRREVGRDGARHRVDAVARDHVAGELRAAVAVGITGQRVVDGHEGAGARGALREVAGEFARGRETRADVAGGIRSVRFGREPEERAVLQERAAETAATEVEVGVGQRTAGAFGEEVVRGAPARTVLVEAAGVPLVGARLGGGVEDAAAGTTRFRVVGVHLHGDAFQTLDRGVGRGAVAQVGNRHAVEQVVVAAARAAAHRQERRVRLVLLAVELRVARGDDRGHRDREEERGTAAARQRFELLRVDDRAGRRVRRVDERGRARDRDGFLQRADFKSDVERDELLGADADALVLVRLEPGQRRLHRVGAWRHGGEVVLTRLVGHDLARGARAFVDQLHRHTGNDAVRVFHRTAQAARKRLGCREASGHGHHQANNQQLPQGLHGHLSLIVPKHSRHPVTVHVSALRAGRPERRSTTRAKGRKRREPGDSPDESARIVGRIRRVTQALPDGWTSSP